MTWETPEVHHLSVTRTARYYTLGRPGPALRELWFVLHGYGQLASSFLEPFRSLVHDETRLFVAPEALSRFYLEGFSGRVGASWMTREDRLAEIADYVAYLDALYNHLQMHLPGSPTLHVLGFSQGAATACRWLALGRARAQRLILWAGDVPEDLPHEAGRRLPPPELVWGTHDPLLDAARQQQLLQRLQRLGLRPTVYRFNGGHRIHRPLLRQLLEQPASAPPS
ncbi:alpha/beta hydrolase [Rhodothermus profundi]|uniref:Predicted esterase n=1 Tax=Rhodothermus profundi TaxID=633813 RepID=A0A1M6VZJ1_9BACT|nr:phospholipase [Rhodothermus profundi]SHK86922.1 Predicted esterase [Rhodothermus profundi]